MTSPLATDQLSPEDLATLAETRVFFGHQSVGQNVLDGVRELYAEHQQPAPSVKDAFIGENEKPLRKIEDFDDTMRSSGAEDVDVAMMKLCYIDITPQTDVDALFDAYRKTLDGLEKDLPRVRFVHVTVPLMTEPGPLSSLKARLTGNERFGPAENVVRERLNALIRREYAGGHLFDLAAVESTTPDGARVSGVHRGTTYYALHDGYASDNGHLNRVGSRAAATAWLTTVAAAARAGQGRTS